ncbi:MAG: LytTR family DNA-binding domain-containing protein [Candidatus Kapabacteria bacterium]|jgi:two-component system LytT family response regulator|nr:LytTR family DNA-binding domain-containing protein [Candidatus Kapabacteria bacterium]
MAQNTLGIQDSADSNSHLYYSVLLVDDEQLARQNILLIVEYISKRYLKAPTPIRFTIGEACNGLEALEYMAKTDVDILIVDIQMPKMNGFQMISALQTQNRKPPAIIFVTAFDKYAIKAFEVSATDYVLKPFTLERFEEAFARALQRVESFQQKTHYEELLAFISSHPLFDFSLEQDSSEQYWQRLTLHSGKRNVLVSVDTILWLSSAESYIEIHTPDANYLLRGSLRNAELHLDPKIFVRIHRSAIVNVNYIKAIEYNAHGDGTLTLTDGSEVKFSRYQKDLLLKVLAAKS